MLTLTWRNQYAQYPFNNNSEANANVLAAEDVVMRDAIRAPQVPTPQAYLKYSSAHEIAYTPEGALEEGLRMVKAISANIKKLELGSKLRKDVWMREIER